MYNPYTNNVYNPQASIDRINNQIAELEKLKAQIPQPNNPPAINQTFQLAPNNQNVIKYANSMEEVQKNIVIGDTPYFSNDMSVVWIKDTKGEIKTYELKEIVPKDEKDIQIEYLQAQLKELKGMINNESNTNIDEPTTKSITSKESSDVPKVSKSKKEPK
jgi:hypothetical protein